MKSKKTSGTFDILHRRYIGENAERQASFEAERVNAEVARTIYELRKKAGLTQKELAQMVGTTQSVISRLEDADYEGHSLSMLNRIAMALNRRLSVQMIEPINEREQMFIRIQFPFDRIFFLTAIGHRIKNRQCCPHIRAISTNRTKGRQRERSNFSKRRTLATNSKKDCRL